METWDNHQLDKNKQHNRMRITWADIDLEFFPGSIILVWWVERSLMPPLERPHPPQRIRACKLSSLTSSWLVFYWRLHLITSCHQLSKGHKLSPHFCLSCQEQKQLPLAHARDISNIHFSLVIFAFVIQWPLSDLFIYLFIYLSIHSISYKLFNCVTWNIHWSTIKA